MHQMSTCTKFMAIVAAACWIAAAILILAHQPGDVISATHRAAALLLAAGGLLAPLAVLEARREWRMQEDRLIERDRRNLNLGLRQAERLNAAIAEMEMSETPPRGM